MTTQTHLKPDVGISGHLFHTCIELCRISCSFAAKAVTSQSQQRQLSRVLQSLSLWGDSHGVLDGRLDAVLQKSPRLQRLIVESLRSILKQIVHGEGHSLLGRIWLTILAGVLKRVLASDDFQATSKSKNVAQLFEQSSFVKNDSYEEYSDIESDEDELDPGSFDLSVAGIRNSMRNLVDLNTVLDTPFVYTHGEENTAAAIQGIYEIRRMPPHHAYSTSIRENFPKAPADTVDLLGTSNLERYKLLLEIRSKRGENEQPLVLTETGISGARSEACSNNDSGYGSLNSTTVYAPSTASSQISSLTTATHSIYPPLSEKAKAGEPFECHACGRDIIAKKTQQWR